MAANEILKSATPMPAGNPSIPLLAANLPRRRLRRGMTIFEVLIATVLLGFVIMTSLTALSQAYGFTRHARMITLAGQLVQSVVEDLRLKNYSQISAYAAQSQPVSFTSSISSEGFSSNFTQGFTMAGTFTTMVASSSPTLGKISVKITVTWTENTSTFTRSVITYFGEKGLSDYYYVGWSPS